MSNVRVPNTFMTHGRKTYKVSTIGAELKRLGMLGHVADVSEYDLGVEIAIAADDTPAGLLTHGEKEGAQHVGRLFCVSSGYQLFAWAGVGRSHSDKSPYLLGGRGVAVVVDKDTVRLVHTA